MTVKKIRHFPPHFITGSEGTGMITVFSRCNLIYFYLSSTEHRVAPSVFKVVVGVKVNTLLQTKFFQQNPVKKAKLAVVVCFHCHKALLIYSVLLRLFQQLRESHLTEYYRNFCNKICDVCKLHCLEIVNTKVDVVDVNFWSSSYSGSLNASGSCSEYFEKFEYFEKVCLFLQDLTGNSQHCVLSGNEKRMCQSNT